jgi:hypothetical protein
MRKKRMMMGLTRENVSSLGLESFLPPPVKRKRRSRADMTPESMAKARARGQRYQRKERASKSKQVQDSKNGLEPQDKVEEFN